jgi:hypothetical protein
MPGICFVDIQPRNEALAVSADRGLQFAEIATERLLPLVLARAAMPSTTSGWFLVNDVGVTCRFV